MTAALTVGISIGKLNKFCLKNKRGVGVFRYARLAINDAPRRTEESFMASAQGFGADGVAAGGGVGGRCRAVSQPPPLCL